MGRAQVVQLTCDRCRRVEARPLSDLKTEGPMFEGQFMGEHVRYPDLCSGCEEILRNHWRQIAHKLEKASPIFKSRR